MEVRYPQDPGPLVPGQKDLRYRMLPDSDHDVRRVRADCVESGNGLYVVELGDTGVRALVEAWYPDGIRDAYYQSFLDPFRKADYEMGRLIVVGELFKWVGEIDPRRITEVNRNARNVHSELRRQRHATDFKNAMRNEEEAKFQKVEKEWADQYEDAYHETQEYAMGKPHVPGANFTSKEDA